MLYFFRRGAETITCETRLEASGQGFELVVTQGGRETVERFATVADMLAREHELLHAWRAIGWRDVGAKSPPRPAQ